MRCSLLAILGLAVLTSVALQAQESPAPEAEQIAQPSGSLAGQVLDSVTGEPIAEVLVAIPTLSEKVKTNEEGIFTFSTLPVGTYKVAFVKTGYKVSSVTGTEITEGKANSIELKLVPREPVAETEGAEGEISDFSSDSMDDGVLLLDEILVEASALENSNIALLELRRTSEVALNVLSAEDISKFAASDVASAIKRIPGVVVQGGQFAVIRGLDERYSATLFNGAPVPSPDPNKQSVPLDLFPSEIVSNLLVSKTFSADLPSNAVGGAIDIRTNYFPEEFSAKISGGFGYNVNAQDEFYQPSQVAPSFNLDRALLGGIANRASANSLIGRNSLAPVSQDAPLEWDISMQLGGTTTLFKRKLRYMLTAATEEDFETQTGKEENSEGFDPVALINRADRVPPFYQFPFNGDPNLANRNSGDLVRGTLGFSSGSYDLTTSTATQRQTLLLSTLADMDKEGLHQLGYTLFYIETVEDRAALRENGNYDRIFASDNPFDSTDGFQRFGELNGFINALPGGVSDLQDIRFWDTTIGRETRLLKINQFTGTHDFSETVDGLGLDWVFSTSDTEQNEDFAFNGSGIQYPDGSYTTGQTTDFQTLFTPTLSWRVNEEHQDYTGVEINREFDANDDIKINLALGYNYENTVRNVAQEFYSVDDQFADLDLSNPTTYPTQNDALQGAIGGVNSNIESDTYSNGEREVSAIYLKAGANVNEKLNFSAGFRFETLDFSTETSTGENFFNFELLRDNSTAGSATPTRAIENAAILGLPGPLPSDFIGNIDEEYVLPAISASYSPNENIKFLVAYSETVARPSFREFTYITTRDPLTLEYVSGNPTLTVSDARNFDARVDINFPKSGDFLAFSVFGKTISDPIEKTTLRGAVETDIFFNNPNEATLRGIEFEARKRFIKISKGPLKHFSFGGNFTYIDATVDVPDNFISLVTTGLPYDRNGDGVNDTTLGGGHYAYANPSDPQSPFFASPETSRPLFAQPEWIFNADVSFEHYDWGTRATLSLFSQSDVLENAAGYNASNSTAIPDQYLESYAELNFTFRQKIGKYLSFGFSAKNLTDSERNLIYDQDVVTDPSIGPRRTLKLGREYSVSLTATF